MTSITFNAGGTPVTLNLNMPTSMTTDDTNPAAQQALQLLEALTQSSYSNGGGGATTATSIAGLPAPVLNQLMGLTNQAEQQTQQQTEQQLAAVQQQIQSLASSLNVPGVSARASSIQTNIGAIQSLINDEKLTAGGGIVATSKLTKGEKAHRAKFKSDLSAAVKDGKITSAENKKLVNEIKKANPADSQYYANLAQDSTDSLLTKAVSGLNATSAATTAAGGGTVTLPTSTTTASTGTDGIDEPTPVDGTSGNDGIQGTGVSTSGSGPATSTTAANSNLDDGLKDPGNTGDIIGDMSDDEKQYYNELLSEDPTKAKLFLLQTRMQNLNEMITFLTQMQQIRHDNAKAILQNLHV